MTRKQILKEIKKWYDDVQQRYNDRKDGEWTEEEFEMDVLFAELAERLSKIGSEESE